MSKIIYKSNRVYVAGTIFLFFFVSFNAMAKEIHLQGTVTCKEKGDVGARPANSILVAPKKFINKTKLTDGQGLYNIGLPAAEILDKSVTIHFRNEKGDLGQLTELIWDAQVRRFKDQLVFFTQTSEVSKPCGAAENDPQKMQKQLALFTEKPEKARRLLDATAAGGGATVLASLPSFGGAAVGGPVLNGVFTVTGISQPTAVAGQLSSVALSAKSAHPGFNFSPTRNIADATFWNAAALALSMRRAINVVSDFDEFSRLSVATTMGDRIGFGFGVIKLNQEDRRTASLLPSSSNARTQSFEFDELGVFVSGGIQLNPQAKNPVALGVTLKYVSQDLEIAGIGDVITDTPGLPSVWEISTVSESQTDFDLSLSYQASAQLNIGLTLMSLLDEKQKDGTGADRSQRTAGLGVSYKMGRTHVGAELIYRDAEEETDVAFGANTVPFNNAQISAGYDSSYETTSLGVSYYWFSYAYNNSELFDTSHTVGVNYQF